MVHFTWFQLLEGPVHGLEGIGLSHDESVFLITTSFIAVVIIALALVARRGLDAAMARQGTARFVPDSGFSIRNLMEIYTESILNMIGNVLGKKDARYFFWLPGALFIYILFNNLLAVLPGGLPATQNVNTNAAMAITVFLVFNIAGLARNGLGYIKHMAGPVWYLAWLILPIELIGVLVRPASLSLRLAGNMVGDHTVFGLMSDLTYLVIPAVFLGLGIFVSFLQAFVFTLLSTIYIRLSVAHDESHH